jgi:exonuclease SbcC
MIITELILRNIKSYQQETITFTPGINAICGPNGAGKSTILEAIGFALFGHLSYSQADFVREGEKTGTVEVRFLSTRDEREYQVVRRCGASDHKVYDPALNHTLAQGKNDVLDWLRDHFHLDEADDLATLFENAVGVPQGLCTATFLEPPAQRKAVFDPLLRVDEYERAWEQLRSTETYLKDHLADGRVQIARLEAAVKPLPDREASAEHLRQEIAGDTERLELLQQELAQVTEQHNHLLALKQERDGLHNQFERLSGVLDGLMEQQKEASERVREATAAQQVVAETTAGYQDYQTAQQEITRLEERVSERDKLAAQRSEQEHQRALAHQRQADFTATLQTIMHAAEQMELLLPQVQQQEHLETALRDAEREVERLDAAQQQLTEAQDVLHRRNKRLATMRSELERLHVLEQEIATADARLRTLNETATRLHAAQQQMQTVQPQIEQRLALLQTTETTIAYCPVCQQSLTAEQAADLAATYRAELQQLTADLTTNQQQQAHTHQQRQAVEQQRNDHQQQAQHLAREEQVRQGEHDVQEQQEHVDRLSEQVRELEAAPAQVEQVRQQLAALDDPRTVYQQYQFQAARREETQEKLEHVQAEIVAVDGEITRLVQALQPYTGLDAALQQAKTTRDATADAYQQYLSHVNVAQSLQEREAKVAELDQHISDYQQQQTSLQQQIATLTSRYDEATYQRLEGDYQRLSQEQTTRKERLRLQRDQLGKTEQEILALRDQQAALVQARADQVAQEEIARRAAFVRSTLREAGPSITRARVQRISQEASLIFGEILNNYALRLSWSETYEITVENQGRLRAFSQLSGGEQMAAALAVRLALLKEMTGIDVAFFDEPTTNLDGERRDNLAEQMMNIRGFSQLFVISHDDTFERSTQHVIRIAKDNGVSRVLG